MKRRTIVALSLLMAVLLMAGCSGSTSAAPKSSAPAASGSASPASSSAPAAPAKPPEKTKITFADVGWDSILFHNAVAGTIAEEVFSYEWTEISGGTPITYEAVMKGEIDVHMEIWTDNLPDYDGNLAAGKFKELSTNFDDNMQGIYVPRYVIEGDASRGIEPMAPELKTVEDLKKYPEVFKDPEDPSKGRLYGALPGWAIDKIMYNKYMFYGLDETFTYFQPGTDAAMSAAMVSAYDKGEAIAAYYWEPTWLLGKYDFVLLEDAPYQEDLFQDGKCACPAVPVMICVSNQFAESNPEFCEFLSKYETSSALCSEALAYMQETGSNYADTAKWFLGEHSELVDEWLTADQAQKLREAL